MSTTKMGTLPKFKPPQIFPVYFLLLSLFTIYGNVPEILKYYLR